MKRVVVIGGGIIGLSCAEALISRGHEVTVCDPSLGAGCSYGNGGIIVPSHFTPIASPGMVQTGLKMLLNQRSPFGLAGVPDLEVLGWMAKFLSAANPQKVEAASHLLKDLNIASRNLYEALIEKIGAEVGYARKGLLMICQTQHGLDEELAVAEAGRKLGLQIEPVGKEEMVSLEYGVEMRLAGAVHFKDDAHLTPSAYMKVLMDYLQTKGVKFVAEGAGEPITREDNLVAITTPSGELEADEFVFATGVWAADWGKKFGLKLPMLSGRGYGMTLPASKMSLTHPAILVEARIAVTPMLDGTRFVGNLELGKPKDRPPTQRLPGMLSAIPDYYPNLSYSELASLPVWTGHRPCTPDGLPYLGRSQKIGNAIWAAGHAMMGMSLGPITGSLVSQIVDGEPTVLPTQLLSPDRYA